MGRAAAGSGRHHVDAAARELIESAFEPLDPARCAQLLHGERGFWVSDYLDPGDPPPAFGLLLARGLDALAIAGRRSRRARRC